MGRWRGYTPEEREGRRLADKALRKAADELLNDPGRVEVMTAQVQRLSARIVGYSLRNQALLISQAETRGIPLSDVDSVKGWRMQGRKVRRGERGLRIVAPNGRRESAPGQPQDATVQQDGEHAQDQEQDDLRFRMISVFDLSQTEELSPIHPAEPDTADAPRRREVRS